MSSEQNDDKMLLQTSVILFMIFSYSLVIVRAFSLQF